MDDGIIHRGRIAQSYKQENNVHVMAWSAQTPYANIIEKCMLFLKNKLNIKQHFGRNNNVADLNREIYFEWENMPLPYNSIRNICRRLLPTKIPKLVWQSIHNQELR